MRLMDGTMRALYTVKRPPILERLLKDEYEQTLVAELGTSDKRPPPYLPYIALNSLYCPQTRI